MNQALDTASLLKGMELMASAGHQYDELRMAIGNVVVAGCKPSPRVAS